MIDVKVQKYNRERFERFWNSAIEKYGVGDCLTFAQYRPVSHYADEAFRLTGNMIELAAADSYSPVQQYIPKIAKLIIDLATEALHREDTIAYGEMIYKSKDEWLTSGRHISYESLAFAHWFLTRKPVSAYWKQAVKAIEAYLLVTRLKKFLLEDTMDYALLSMDYSFAIDHYHRYEKHPIDIGDYTSGKLLKKYYALMYLIAEYELHDKPSSYLKTIDRSLQYFYDKALDWRIGTVLYLTNMQRFVIAYLLRQYLHGSIEPIVLAQGIRGFNDGLLHTERK